MAWSPLTVGAIGCIVWAVLAAVLGWGFSRWFRFVRGDFDRPPH